MAKSSAGKTGGTSRIRFIMVDAEIADGDINSVTQAITSALRGPAGSPPVRRLAPAPATNGAAAEPQEIDGEFEESKEDEIIDASPTPARPRAPRKPGPMPKVIEFDIDSDPSLAAFAAKTNPNSHHKRYLVAAAWLHLHRKADTERATNHQREC
jgi:hypothetical protein